MTPLVDLRGKLGLVIGIANGHSIAAGCAEAFAQCGARLAATYLNDRARDWVTPVTNRLGVEWTAPCDVREPGQLEALFGEVSTRWGGLDFLLHSIAFAPREDLHGRVVDSSAEGFATAMDVSCHSFLRMAKLAEPLMTQGGCLLCVTFYGSERVVEHYNLMGPVKAALESATRYVAAELGPKAIRAHAISPGPIATRAASGIDRFDELLEQAASSVPRRQLVETKDVGALAAFFGERRSETDYRHSHSGRQRPASSRMSRLIFLAVAGCAASLPNAASAARPVEILIGHAGRSEIDGAILIELRLLNGGTEPQSVALPNRIQARVEQANAPHTIWLSRAATTPANVTVAPSGFVPAAYEITATPETSFDGATISIPAWNSAAVRIALQPALEYSQSTQAIARPPVEASSEQSAATPPSDRAAGNAFLANLSAYEPIYAAYGPGTNSEARIQISFKYQLFGSRQAEGLPRSWRDGLHFAYSQRMFWDMGADSSPFRNIDYQPELLYLTPSATFSSGTAISGQGGIRHESNGRDGPASRSINSIYVAPMAAIPLGDGYQLSIAPRLSFFVGDKSENPDIHRYRGNTSLFIEVGEAEGLRLSTSTRFNFSSGKGAIAADLSYPLARLLGGGPDFYLFGQSFVGYGENLLDYDRRTSRFRIGLALVR